MPGRRGREAQANERRTLPPPPAPDALVSASGRRRARRAGPLQAYIKAGAVGQAAAASNGDVEAEADDVDVVEDRRRRRRHRRRVEARGVRSHGESFTIAVTGEFCPRQIESSVDVYCRQAQQISMCNTCRSEAFNVESHILRINPSSVRVKVISTQSSRLSRKQNFEFKYFFEGFFDAPNPLFPLS